MDQAMQLACEPEQVLTAYSWGLRYQQQARLDLLPSSEYYLGFEVRWNSTAALERPRCRSSVALSEANCVRRLWGLFCAYATIYPLCCSPS